MSPDQNSPLKRRDAPPLCPVRIQGSSQRAGIAGVHTHSYLTVFHTLRKVPEDVTMVFVNKKVSWYKMSVTNPFSVDRYPPISDSSFIALSRRFDSTLHSQEGVRSSCKLLISPWRYRSPSKKDQHTPGTVLGTRGLHQACSRRFRKRSMLSCELYPLLLSTSLLLSLARAAALPYGEGWR
jgi:hypothetical protein